MEHYLKPILSQNKLGSIVLCFLTLSTIFILFFLNSSNPFVFVVIEPSETTPEHIDVIPPPLENSTAPRIKQSRSSAEDNVTSSTVALPPSSPDQYSTVIQLNQSIVQAEDRKVEPDQYCNLFAGRWVRDPRGSIYTNVTCKTLPDVRNCGRHGKDQGYVYWRWKPDGCDLAMFDPEKFLKIVTGKKLMFIGDSLARNQMESLLCQLSQAEMPVDTYRDSKDKHRTWYFPSYNFTLMVIWTEFLVDGYEIISNGTPSNTFNITLDRMNPIWAKKLPELSYAVINSGNWFTRRTYIYKRGRLIGCVHCWGENVASISVPAAIRMVFKEALKHISKCEKRDDLLTVMRTYSMSHFEHGSWFTGGDCNRTEPLTERELSASHEAWEFRRIQMEELERVIRKKWIKARFELMDVTMAMMLRADAHPGSHWVAKVTRDCLHWCLPGPIDLWNELLLEIFKRHYS